MASVENSGVWRAIFSVVSTSVASSSLASDVDPAIGTLGPRRVIRFGATGGMNAGLSTGGWWYIAAGLAFAGGGVINGGIELTTGGSCFSAAGLLVLFPISGSITLPV